MEHKQCQRCGGTQLEPGTLGSSGVVFRPQNTKFFSLKTNDIVLKANMCVECGHVEFVGDPRALQSLLGKQATAH